MDAQHDKTDDHNRERLTHDHNRIVVGVDGSMSARNALRWAADEARLHDSELQLVHAWRPLLQGSPDDPGYAEALAASHAHGEEVLGSALAHLHLDGPGIASTGLLERGRPSAILLKACHGARMLVVGARGMGGFAGLQMGSVSLHVVSNAPCPVVVVRNRLSIKGPVVVGIDGSTESKRVLATAFDEAARRRAELLVVSALYVHSRAEGAPDYEFALAATRAELRRAANAFLADVSSGYPDVHVQTDFPVGYPAAILADHSAAAQLLVVGAHGGGGFSGMRLGSIAHAVVHRSHCPIMVVRESAA